MAPVESAGGQDQPVVLVRLVDDAPLVVLDEVAGQLQMMGGQVGEAVCRHLIRHREHIPKVLDGQVPGLLGLGQEARGGSFRDQHGRGVVVCFHPLAQEVREITRRRVPEHEMAEGLQQDRAGRVHAHGFLLQVDPPVAQVGDGPDRTREILRVPDRETLVADDGQQRPLRQRAAPVAHGRSCAYLTEKPWWPTMASSAPCDSAPPR